MHENRLGWVSTRGTKLDLTLQLCCMQHLLSDMFNSLDIQEDEGKGAESKIEWEKRLGETKTRRTLSTM